MINIKFLARKYLYYNFIFQPLFQSAHHFMRKRKIRIRTCDERIRMRIRDAQKHTDPEHCLLGWVSVGEALEM